MNEYDIISMYDQMERELIASMKRNLARHKKEEEKVGFEFSQWQQEKLKSLKKYRKENKHIIEAYTKGMNKDVIAMLSNEMKQGKLSAFEEYKKALKDGYKTDASVTSSDSFFKTNSRKANTFIKVINNDLKTANKACLRRSNDIYREVIHKASTFVSNGVYTERKAIDMAIKEFADKGVNCIVYKNGARHTISDYTAMAIRTANQRAQLMAEGEFRKKIGETLVLISKHGTACKICQQFENKIFIDDIYSGGSAKDGNYTLLSQAMKEGMFHPNCRHGLNTYYEGITDVAPQKTEGIKAEQVRNETTKETKPTIETLSKTGTDAMQKNYEERRIAENLNVTPIEELKKSGLNNVKVDYTGTSVETAEAINETLTDLFSRYRSKATSVSIMKKEDVLGVSAWGRTHPRSVTADAIIEFNPLKMNNFEKMCDRINELSEKGYCVKIPKINAKKYIATHEFGHSLMDMQSQLKNYVGYDVEKAKSIRKAIEDIFEEYKNDVYTTQKNFKSAELDFLNTLNEKSMENARKYKARLDNIKISDYSLENSDEFFAEAFTQAELSENKNEYVDKVMKIINENFRK